jgi:TonB family protein
MGDKARKARGQLLVTAGLVLITALQVGASDVKIIANASVKAHSISTSEIKGVFLQERKMLRDGSLVVPVLEKSGATHEAFLRQYMNRDSEELNIYYEGLTFSGKGTMPKELSSDQEVVAYVAKTKGAIGYVSGATTTEGVKILQVLSEGQEGERVLITRVEPNYPETLRRLGIGGVVRLKLAISPKGGIESVELLGGNPILGESAMAAVRQWVYSASRSRTLTEVSIPFEPH